MHLEKSKVKEKIMRFENYTIVGVGDSHMWGEGAAGWDTALNPRHVAGERRRLPDGINCFFTLFANHISLIRKDIGKINAINSGIGSTSTKKYIEHFWDSLVVKYKPDLVILEFAINDWLSDREVSIEEFKQNLNYMASQIIRSGGDVVLLTVSPILGDQYSGNNYYEDYITASREVALSDPGIILADANLYMKKFLNEGNRQENEKSLYDDIWHVSQIGHEMYFQSIVEALGIE